MGKNKSGHVAEGVDRLITLDLRARGVIYRLYEAARRLTSAPLTLTAAENIMEAAKSGDTVLITTGFRVLPQRVQETDGPLGAASLARALRVALNVRSILLIEEPSRGILTAALRGLGMNTNRAERYASVLSFPLGLKEAVGEAKRVLDECKPSLVLAIEKAGRNSRGEYHTMRGLNISSSHAKVEPLFEEAQKRGVLTVGIGDGGNEVGMGNIKKAVEAHVPHGLLCQCPCKGGIAANSKVDVLVASAISNWGAYGIEACLACLTGKPEVLHTTQQEESMLKAAVEARAIDGVTGRPEHSVDGAPLHLHLSLISMLQALTGK